MTEITEEMVEAAARALYEDDDLWSSSERPWPARDAIVYRRLARAALTAAFTSRPSQGGEWVIVPRTETDEMCEAGLEALRENLGHSAVIMRDAAACYRAMVHASPLPASPSPYGVADARAIEALRVILDCHDEGPGLIDSIDNDGERYTSQGLDDAIKSARAALSLTKDQSNG